MKVTNISNARIYLKDLRLTNASQADGRRGEDRYIGPGTHEYLPNTSEVLRSAIAGDIRGLIQAGKVTIEDVVELQANGSPGDSVVLTHNFHFPPGVAVLKQVGATWVDGTGTVDIVHNQAFTTTTLTNTTAFTITFLIRLL